MENRVYNEEEIEIDLLRLFYAIREKIWVIIAVAFLFACGAFAFTHFLIAPTYTSTSAMLVLTKETTLSSLADLQMGSQLTQDYKVLTTSRPVLEEVIDNLGMDMKYKDLRKKIKIENPDDTRLLYITVTMSSPELAKTVVNELAIVASNFIGDKMEVVPPKIIEEGELPLEKASPSLTKNTLIGMIVGGFLMCAIVVILELLNDSIQTENDIERYLGIPTLAVVPVRDNQNKSKKNKGKKNNSCCTDCFGITYVVC